MSIVKTQACKSSYTRLSYILSGEPHNTNKVSQRVLAVYGQNVNLLHDRNGYISTTQSGAYLERQFHQSLMKARNPKRTYQCQSIIISFSQKELDTSNIEEQASQANHLAQLYVKRFFSDAQAISVVQADGNGGKIHIHILVNAVNRQGKTIQTNRFSIFHLRKQFDKFMNQSFENVTGRPWPGPSNQRQRLDSNNLTTKSEWQKHIKQVIEKVKLEVSTINDFLTKLSNYGITVTNRSKKTAWTYHQQVKTAKGIKEYRVRDYYERRDKKTGEIKSIRGLGKDFTKASITEYFESKNKKEVVTYGKRKSTDESKPSEQSNQEVREQARIANLQLEQQREQQRRTLARLNAFASLQTEDDSATKQHRKQARQFSDKKRRRKVANAARRNDSTIPTTSRSRKSKECNRQQHYEAEGPSI